VSGFAPTVKLGTVAQMGSGGTPPSSVARYYGGGIPWVSIADMTTRGKYIHGTERTLSTEGLNSSAAKLYEPDVVLYAMYASLGECSLAVGRVSSSQAILGIKPGPRLDREYLYYYLHSIKPTVKTMGQQGTQSNLNAGMVRDFDIPLPPLDEQRHIACALSDADAETDALERLIAKKRAIKQGLIQELLSGRTRLPGYVGRWKRRRLGDVLKVRNGRNQRQVEVAAGRYPILATGGEIGRTDTALYSKPSVLIGRKGTIDRPQFQESPFWTVDTLFYTEIGRDADPRFLFYLFCTVDWASMNEATGVPSLTGTRIEAVEASFPEPDEQQAIAGVLRDTDAEIDTLERRVEAAREVKQGMMQELLTGRIRLPVEGVAI